MILPEIDPIIFSIGPLSIRWYGLMYLIGFIFVLWMANRQADRSDGVWTREEVSDLMFAAFLGVILGGRVGYVLFYGFDQLMDNPLFLFKITDGGMSFHGGLLGVLLAFLWFAKRTKRTFFMVADFIAPYVPFGLGVGRIGNFINGELWGRETDVPWGMVFPLDRWQLARHPSQLYEAFLEGIVLLIILLWYSKKRPPEMAVSGLFLLGYGCFRFIVEFFREPDAQLGLFDNFISMGQILSAPMIIFGIILLIWSYKRDRFAK